ncbi:hypothetical protein [Streptosporangium sp. NBC_01756]|uniref:hypothetical protein n=1 Tax=Streptosporangium sp. NBC_01756 TaxID=2975950 RepID=UPI002DD8CEE8|nr:hypothetical protein [Streptosporangium sp. NBC_01756]WSC88718.1 hypothetical protein OIE48_11185 [Streptosporangium sp. NBC_01756]
MGAELEVDYAQLRRSGEGITDTHARAQAETLAFLEGVVSYGQPWGVNNAVGEAIGMCYGSAYEAIKDCVQSNLDEYRAYAGGLQAMTATYRSGEKLSGEHVDGLLT